MSDLFDMRYPGRTQEDVLIEYIRRNPGCTYTDMRRDLPSVSCEPYLAKMLRKGIVERYGGGPFRFRMVSE